MALADKSPKVLVVHGPNLNMLGQREPEVYGTTTLDQINEQLRSRGEKLGLSITSFQSNHEGEIVEKIQSIHKTHQGCIINPAAYTHTSVAIRDALLLIDMPIIEIHLSNIYKREEFRHHSMIAGVATGQISGLGVDGYLLALDAISRLILSPPT